MKKILWKTGSILLVVLTLLGMIPSCKSDEEEPIPETTGSERDFFEGRADEYVILYPEGAKTSVVNAAKKLANALNDNYGLNLKCRKDSVSAATENATEILVGKTNRDESKALASTIAEENDYAIQKQNNRLLICGGNYTSTAYAVDYFIENYVIGKTVLLLEPDYHFYHSFKEKSAVAFQIAEGFQIQYCDDEYGVGYGLATMLQSELKNMTGVLAKASTSVKNGAKKVIIEASDSSMAYHDYQVILSENLITVKGGSTESLKTAIETFTEKLYIGEIATLSDDHSISLTFQTKYPCTFSLDTFVPSWKNTYTPSAWMRDLNEKIEALTAVLSRNMSAVKSGDRKNYTPGSFESIASAIQAGVDLLEVNVFETKDHVLVVLDYADLASCTNASEMSGKIGAAASTQVDAWTFDQIAQLTVKDSSYRVPTLAEVVKLCSGRCLLSLKNKTDSSDWKGVEYEVYTAFHAVDSYYQPDADQVAFSVTAVQTTLTDWYRNDPSNQQVAQLRTKYSDLIQKENHWIRWPVTVSEENPAAYQRMRDQWDTFLYTNDIVEYCKYIQSAFRAASDSDYQLNSQPYSLSESEVGYRIMVISDLHYFVTDTVSKVKGELGVTRDQKRELIKANIQNEIDGRGLDAILVLGDLATDNWVQGASNNTYHAKDFYDDCLAPFKNQIGIFVLAGDHDSFMNDKWKEMFGNDRQFSFEIGNTVFIMLDVFEEGSNSKTNGSALVGIDEPWLEEEIAKYPGKNVILCAHYFEKTSKELNELAKKHPEILCYFYGHSHCVENVNLGDAWLINDGCYAYSTYQNKLGEWRFDYLDLKSLWGYQIVEWTGDCSSYVTYHVYTKNTYQASNIHCVIPENVKTSDIIIK